VSTGKEWSLSKCDWQKRYTPYTVGLCRYSPFTLLFTECNNHRLVDWFTAHFNDFSETHVCRLLG